MPKSLDPNFKLTLVLASDVDKPEATQPRIFARTLTLGQLERVEALKDAKSTSAITDALMMCLVGWENMNGLEFNRENVANVLDADEAAEIIEFVCGHTSLSVDERKK